MTALLPATAHADPATTYRAELAGTDGASLVLATVGVKTKNLPLTYTGAAGMALGAGIVHFVHGDYEGGGISIGFHVAFPMGTTLTMLRVFKPCAEGGAGCAAVPVLAALAGFVAADLADVFWLTPDAPQTGAAPRMISFGLRGLRVLARLVEGAEASSSSGHSFTDSHFASSGATVRMSTISGTGAVAGACFVRPGGSTISGTSRS